MRIKKAASIIVALMFTLSLAGCTGSNSDPQSENSFNESENSSAESDNSSAESDNSSAESDNSSAESDNSSAESDNSFAESDNSFAESENLAVSIIKSDKLKEPEGFATRIIGLDGDPIYTSEFSQYIDKDGKQAVYSEGNLGTAICEGFAYIASNGGSCLTDRDNADVYNEGSLSFSGVTDEKLQNYVRIDAGDKVNGLTVYHAKTLFRADEMGLPGSAVGKDFAGCEVTFLDDLELHGYACAIKDDAYGVQAGDILFVPQGKCPLPVMSFQTDMELGTYHSYYTGSDYGLTWVNQYGQIFLGNTQTTDADVSCLPADGSFVKVKAVVKGIRMTSSVDWIDIVQASIITIERE